MHYLDPSRPRLSSPDSLPLLQGVPGRYVLPCLHISPRGTPDAPLMEISIFLPSPLGGASRRGVTMPFEAFALFWSEWLEDPERVAKHIFNWEGPSAPQGQKAAPKTVVLDLDELLGDL